MPRRRRSSLFSAQAEHRGLRPAQTIGFLTIFALVGIGLAWVTP